MKWDWVKPSRLVLFFLSIGLNTKEGFLVICPANLRKQWAGELQEKFFLPSVIMESKSFNEAVENGCFNPFDTENIVICSLQFAKTKAAYIKRTAWDLVIVDEAHRLRNVYKPQNRIANVIKESIEARKKILMTATPFTELHFRIVWFGVHHRRLCVWRFEKF